MNRRVVITGLGTVNPLGLSLDEYWQNLAAGKSGVTPFSRFDNSTMSVRFAGSVRDFDHLPYFQDAKMARRMDRTIILGHVSGMLAYEDAGLKDQFNPELTGVTMGTGMGGVGVFEAETELKKERGHKRVSPFFVPMVIPNTVAASIAIENNFQGPNFVTVTACASANHAMGEAFEIIKRGDADIMFTGGAEAALREVVIAGFANMKALSTRNDAPEKASRPFDADRDGFVIAEGAAVLVLEELEHAKARGARIYAEFAGFGQSCDAYHITAPHPDGSGGLRSMRMALKSARLNPEDIGLVNAHGTSTPLGDAGEIKAIKACFGEHAKIILVHSTKSMVGHSLGAAGAVELVADIPAITTGLIHPTINYETKDPDCDLNYVPNQAIEKKVNAILSNSFGFGGHNATVVIKRFEG